MAGRLPAYEAGVAATADRRVVNIPVPNMDTGEGAALRSVGNAVAEFGQRIEKARNDRELLTADRKVRESLDRLRFDIEQTPTDVPAEKLRQRFDEESERIIQAAGGQIGNASIRDIWTERAKGLQGDGALWTDQLGRKRSVEGVRAGHVTAGAEIEAKAGDPAITRETIEAMVSGEQAAIRRAGEIGIYSPEEAAARIAAMDRVVTKDASIRFSANINEMVKQGRVAEAQAYFDANNATVDPQTRETVKAGLQASQQEFAVVEKGDDIWLRSGGNYGKAIELAAEIADAPLRLKVEARLGQKRDQAKVAHEDLQDSYVTQLWDHVREGGAIASASPSLMGRFDSPGRFDSVRIFENARDAEAGRTAAQNEEHKLFSSLARNMLESSNTMPPHVFMSDPGTWRTDHRAYFENLSTADQTAIHKRRSEMRETGSSVTEIDRIEKMLIDEAKRSAPAAWKFGATGNSPTAQATTLTGLLRSQAASMAKDVGGATLKPEDVGLAVASAFSEIAGGKDLDYVRWQRLGANVRAAAYETDPVLWGQASQLFLETYGREPTPDEAGAAYRTLTGQQ